MAQTTSLVGAPLASTMVKMAVPGVVGALLFSGPGLLETVYLRHAGADALAAVAMVFPLIMLAMMFSAGAFGGAVSGRTARAIGAGDYSQASAILVCAVLISFAGGLIMWLLAVKFGPLLYERASSNALVSNAAIHYTAMVFPAMPAIWLLHMLCSVLRGTGDMVRPAIAAATLIVAYLVFAKLLITDNADLNATVRAAAMAMVCANLVAMTMVIVFILQKRQPIRPKLSSFNFTTLAAILKQGSLASSQSVMTISYAMVTTVLFSRLGTEWLAGFGLAVRLELIMVPIIFGMGASLIAIVGAYVGAGQRSRAISIAWRGVFINAALLFCAGLLVSLFPGVWCNLSGSDETVIDHCSLSLRFIAPTYAFLALGLGCYFASQGLDTLKYPVLGALLRLLIVTTGLFWVTDATSIYATLGLVVFAVVAYGTFVVIMLKYRAWAS